MSRYLRSRQSQPSSLGWLISASGLADVPGAGVDAALDRMYRSQRINLIPQSSPRVLSARGP